MGLLDALIGPVAGKKHKTSGGFLDSLFGPIAGSNGTSKSKRRGSGRSKSGMSLAELFEPVTQSPPARDDRSGGGFLDRLLGPPPGAWVDRGFNDTTSASGFRPGNRIEITTGARGGGQATVEHVDDRQRHLLVRFDGGLFTHNVPFDKARKVR